MPPKRVPDVSSAGSLVFYVVLLVYAIVVPLTLWRHLALPDPVQEVLPDKVSERLAFEHVKELSSTLRIVGTKGEESARNYVIEALNKIRDDAKENPFVQVEVTTETFSGSQRFDLMGAGVFKLYNNITNVIARLTCGEECNQNAILVNAHLDGQLGTPGAVDDIAAVGVMIEVARIISQRKVPMRNAVVLLFNCAEESLQDASHAFVYNSELAKTIRGFVNLEGMGNYGKEVLFQSNSRQMVEAYSVVPRPHGTVVSNDIFKSGLVLSDTDFRQFVDHGKMHGIDMAIYQNSYVYHTMLDVAENIEPGLLQHMGDNVLAIVSHLAGNVSIEKFEPSRDYLYYDFFGYFFLVYPWSTAELIHAITVVVCSLLVFRPILSRSDAARSIGALAVDYAGVAVSLAAGLVAPAIQGAVLQFVLNKPMTYFRREWLAFLLFAPSSISAIVGSQFIYRRLSPLVFGVDTLDNAVNRERRAFSAVALWYATIVGLTTWARLGSSFSFNFFLLSFSFGLVVDRAISPFSMIAPMGSLYPMNPITYVAALILCVALTTIHSATGLQLFVPLTGRIGNDTPVDVIVGGLVGLLSTMGFIIIVPLSARISLRRLFRSWIWSVGLTVVIVLAFVGGSFPYDSVHPKRIFVQYQFNATSGQKSLHVSHSDPPHLDLVIENLSKTFGGVQPQRQTPTENDHHWAAIYPFSHFIESHLYYDISHLESRGVRWRNAEPPQLSVADVSFKDGVRTLTIHCSHPSHIFTVLNFHADVVNWSISASPEVGPQLYVVRQAGGYGGGDRWSLTVSVRAESIDDKLQMHITGVERDTFDRLLPYHKALKGEKPGAHFGWLWGEQFESARVLREVEQAMPEWTSELYLATTVATSNL